MSHWGWGSVPFLYPSLPFWTNRDGNSFAHWCVNLFYAGYCGWRTVCRTQFVLLPRSRSRNLSLRCHKLRDIPTAEVQITFVMFADTVEKWNQSHVYNKYCSWLPEIICQLIFAVKDSWAYFSQLIITVYALLLGQKWTYCQRLHEEFRNKMGFYWRRR